MSNSPVGANVFEDLEISTVGILDGPDSIKQFSERVQNKVAELNEIMSKTTSVNSIEDNAKTQFKSNPAHKELMDELFAEPLAAIYEACEELDLAVVYGLIQELKTLTNNLEDTLHDRAKNEAINSTAALQDKKLAHIQYTRLRNTWEDYRKFVKLFFDLELFTIKPKPGNFQSNLSKTYYFVLEGEDDGFYNPFAAAKKLGIYHNDIRLMDILEYCEKHPELIKITEVPL